MRGRLAACLLFLQATTTILGAPAPDKDKEDASVQDKPDCKTDSVTDVYDQRQNGTDNYRINVKGVMIVLAPPEVALAAAATGLQNNESEDEDVDLKPPPPQGGLNSTEADPNAGGKFSTYRNINEHAKKRLMNFLNFFQKFKPAETTF